MLADKTILVAGGSGFIEIADLFGGKIRTLPERRSNRMNGVLDAAKAKGLGWRTQRGVEDYIASIVEDFA
jgi:UDP-glucose 4-epimerase